jgi:hypothetical protein
MKIPRDLSGQELTAALCRHWELYEGVHYSEMAKHVRFIAYCSLFAGTISALGVLAQLFDHRRFIPIFIPMMIIGFLLALTFLSIFVGLVRFKPWGRSIACGFAALMFTSPFSWYVLWVLTRPGTKELFAAEPGKSALKGPLSIT